MNDMLAGHSVRQTVCKTTYLENLFVFLGLLAMGLLHGGHVVLKVATGMLPGLEALSKDTSCLVRVLAKSLTELAFMVAVETHGMGVELGDGIIRKSSRRADGHLDRGRGRHCCGGL